LKTEDLRRLRIASLSQPARVAALWGVGFATLAVYLWGLVRPYNYFTLGLRPALSIHKFTVNDPFAQIQFILTVAILAGLYYLAWRLCRGQQSRALWTALFSIVLLVNLAMLALYPIDAADVFDNIIRGRITAVYDGNPFYDTPIQYQQDPFYQYAAWHKSPSAYGPFWEIMAAGTSRLAGDGIMTNILAFKSLSLLFYLGCIGLIAATLQRYAPQRALQGVCLFALNPLVIYETTGNAHNDIVMTFFILLGIYVLCRDRFTLAALAFTAGALVKFIPVLLLPLAGITALRTLSGRKKRSHFVIVTALACGLLVVMAYASFWRGGDPLSIKRRSKLFTTSLPALVQVQLAETVGNAESQSLVSRGALVLTGLVVFAATWRTWSEKDWLSPVRAAHFVLLFYLLFTCLWFQPWYVLWLLALAAILPEGEASRTTVLIAYAALWKVVIFEFFLHKSSPLPPRQWRETILGPATLGIVWLYVFYVILARLRRALMVHSPIHQPTPTS
jgi:alpha-1,6-mannosyltransferase